MTLTVTSTLTSGVPMAENGVGWRELSPRSALSCRHRWDLVQGAAAAELDRSVPWVCAWEKRKDSLCYISSQAHLHRG